MLGFLLLSQSADFFQKLGPDLVDTWLYSTLKILFPYKFRVLIFTNSKFDQAQLKAQEEERQKREAEEKEAQLEKKREEKRLKKMVSSMFSQSPSS